MSVENLNKIWKQVLRSTERDKELMSLLFPLPDQNDPLHIEQNIMQYRWLKDEAEKISDKGIEYLSQKKITQGESQKVKQIISVMSTILYYGPIKTTDIKSKTQLSWGSVIRTLKLLREKRIVRVRCLKSKNNQKLYTLNKEKAREYRRNLLMWKYQDDDKSYEKIQEYEKQWMDLSMRLPKGFEDFEINSPPTLMKMLNKKSTKIRIGDLPFPMNRRLMTIYQAGQICHVCFENGDLVEMKRISEDMNYCQKCGELPFTDEICIKRGRKKERRRYDVDKDINRKLKDDEKSFGLGSSLFQQPYSFFKVSKKNIFNF